MSTDTSSKVFVPLKDLAAQLGLDRSNTRKYVLKLGFKPQKQRTSDSGNQKTLVLTQAQAEAVVGRRQADGFLPGGTLPVEHHGYFYVIMLVPELSGRRLKFGFAVDVSDRLQQHRTAAPTARVLKTWPCRRAWELAAMDSLTRRDCKLVASEVFDCDDVDSLLRRGDEFFSMMPNPDGRLELADHSPMAASPHEG